MRKRCKRTPRPTSSKDILLSAEQHDDLILNPRMHLHLLLSGHAEAEYLHSVAGVFNVAVALSHLQGKAADQAAYESVQIIISELICAQRSPTDDEAAIILPHFNAAGRLFRRQTISRFMRAIELVEQMISRGEALPVSPKPHHNSAP